MKITQFHEIFLWTFKNIFVRNGLKKSMRTEKKNSKNKKIE